MIKQPLLYKSTMSISNYINWTIQSSTITCLYNNLNKSTMPITSYINWTIQSSTITCLYNDLNKYSHDSKIHMI